MQTEFGGYMDLTICKISARQTYQLRHDILWPDEPLEHCVLEGDEKALHFGASIGGSLVSVVSLFDEEGKRMRLRKFAVQPEFQGQGIGSALLCHIIEHLKCMSTDIVWCDARVEAIPFYKKQGFTLDGGRFLKSGISYNKMMRQLQKHRI